MKKKMTSKRVLASVAAVALTLTAVNVQPFKDMFNKSSVVYADSYGNSSGGASIGSGSAGSAKAGNFCISGGSSGVRIYLVKDDIVFGEDEFGSPSYETTDITESGTEELIPYRQYAIYELSSVYSGENGSSAVNAGNRDLHMMTYNPSTKLYDMYTVPEAQVLSMGAGLNQNPDFNQLVGTTNGFDYIGDTTLGSGAVLSFTSLASWANGVFGADKMSSPEYMDTFLANYKSIIGEDAFKAADYPETFVDFEYFGWAIVVEPVMMSFIAGENNTTFAFSLQDYIWNAAGGSLSFNVSDNESATMGSIYDDQVTYGFEHERIIPFSNFYANFVLEDLIDASGNPKSKTITGSGDTAGFSIYGTFSGGSRRKTGTLSAAQNFMIAPSEQYKFRSAVVNSDEDDGTVDINAEVSSSALLGMNPAEIIRDPDGEPTKNLDTGFIMYKNDYMLDEATGDYILRSDADTNYDGIKSFLYEDDNFEQAFYRARDDAAYEADVLSLVMPWYGQYKSVATLSNRVSGGMKSSFIPEDGKYLQSLKLFAYANTEGSWNFSGKMGMGTTDTVKPNAIENSDYVTDLREEYDWLIENQWNYPSDKVVDYKERLNELSRIFNSSNAHLSWEDATLRDYAGRLSGISAEKMDQYTLTTSEVEAGKGNTSYYFRSYALATYETFSANGKSLETLKMNIADGDIKFTIEPSTVLNSKGIAEELDTRVFYMGDLFRSYAFYKGARMDTGVSGIVPNVQEGMNGSYAVSSWVDFKGRDGGVPHNETLDDLAANLSLYALANSALDYSNRTTGNTAKGESVIGVAVEQIMPVEYTESYITYGARLQDGEVKTGGYIDTDTGNFSGTTHTYMTHRYVYVDDDFEIRELLDEELLTVYNKEGNTKSRSHDVLTKSVNQIPAVIISIPNSYVNALGYNISEVGNEKFYTDLFTILERDNAKLNDAYCMSTIQDALSEMFGIDVALDSNITVKLASDGAEGKSRTRLLMGAWGNADGELAGYSTYVVQDAIVSDAIECEAELKAYQVNYIYPTILGKTQAALLKAYTNTGTEISFTKTEEYSGALISANAADKITLLYNNADTNNIFAAEQIDPKTFNASDLVPTSDVLGSYGYATLTHMLNLTRKVFNDNMVASSISHRGAGLTADYLANMGINVANKGTDLEGTDGQTTSLGSVYDKFRWSASRGLDLSSNGQSISVTPFSDGQSMDGAGYNLTSYASMYRSNPRGTGDAATSGVIPAALIKATENNLTYKSLSVEAYDTILNFYPEFKMVAYSYNPTPTDGTVSGQPTGEFLYMMVEKVRTVKASGLYYMGMTTAANPMQGTTISDTVATGTNANNLSQKFGGLQVVYAGGNINLDAKANTGVDLDGFVLDLIDLDEDTATLVGASGNVVYTDVIADGSNIKDDWGNAAYVALEEYKAWVNEVRESLGVEMKLTTYQLNGNKVKEYKGYNTQVGKVTGGDITGVTTYVLTFKDGVLVQDNAYNELIKAIAKKYYGTDSPTSVQFTNAKAYFANSNMSASILEAIESSTDSDNGSEVVGIYGDKKWYDEEVRSFVIREYHTTPLKIDNILVSDKIDITAGPSQTGNTAADLFANGYRATWSATIYLNKTNSAYPDMVVYNPTMGNVTAAIESGSVLAYGLKINGADFVISDATTSDMR